MYFTCVEHYDKNITLSQVTYSRNKSSLHFVIQKQQLIAITLSIGTDMHLQTV